MINIARPKMPKMGKYIGMMTELWETHHITNNGKYVKQLEASLVDYLNVPNLILTTNGTLSLLIMLKAFNIQGEVITTPFTFAATTNSIIWTGARPVFVDIDPETFNIDPRKIEAKITSQTTAIMPVHVFGNPCDTQAIEEIASKHGLKVLYDAAHAFGVNYLGRSLASFGDAAMLSFHAVKTFNTIEGGAVVTSDNDAARKLRLMTNFGIESEEEVSLPGINCKMTEFQAVMGICNLEDIDWDICHRKTLHITYKDNLSSVIFQRLRTNELNFTYMPVLFADANTRDRVYDGLAKHDIKARKYFYPVTSSFEFCRDDSCPIAVDISQRILCLPMHYYLSVDDVRRICEVVNGLATDRT